MVGVFGAESVDMFFLGRHGCTSVLSQGAAFCECFSDRPKSSAVTPPGSEQDSVKRERVAAFFAPHSFRYSAIFMINKRLILYFI